MTLYLFRKIQVNHMDERRDEIRTYGLNLCSTKLFHALLVNIRQIRVMIF
jgi:hypothetical protein